MAWLSLDQVGFNLGCRFAGHTARAAGSAEQSGSPRGRSTRLGTVPGITSRRSATFPSTGIEPISPWV